MTVHPKKPPDSPSSDEGGYTSAESWLDALTKSLEESIAGNYPSRNGRLAECGLALVHANTAFIQRVIGIVIPAEMATADALYDHLARLYYVLGHDVATFQLCGIVWRDYLLTLDQESRLSLLISFPISRERNLFQLLRSLPTVLEQVEVPKSEAVPWFKRLREEISNDRADDGYWLGIDAWTAKNPTNAAEALHLILNSNPNDNDLSFGARILAGLRQLGQQLPASVNFAEFEVEWANGNNSKARVIHHRSWMQTLLVRGITDEELGEFLQRFEITEGEELTECIKLLHCLIVCGKTPAQSIDIVLQWLKANVDSQSRDIWKYWICSAGRSVWASDSTDWSLAQMIVLRDLVIEIQPISLEHKGTWIEVDQLLAVSMKSNEGETVDFIERLFDRNPEGFRQLLDRSNRTLTFFMEVAAYPRLPELTSKLFSAKMNRRRLSLSMINSDLPLNLSKVMLDNLSEHELALGLLQIDFDQLKPQQACPLLLMLLPRIEQASPQLQNLFGDELLYQARNLPGLCLEAFKKVKKPSPLLKSSIAAAESYFKQLRNAAASPIAAMHVPGLNQARRAVTLRQSRLIDEKSREGSVFLEFMKSVHLIYGKEGFAHYQENNLSDSTPFQTFSASAELPRLDLMDYDGKMLRRHQTLMQIRSVEEQLQKVTDTRES